MFENLPYLDVAITAWARTILSFGAVGLLSSLIGYYSSYFIWRFTSPQNLPLISAILIFPFLVGTPAILVSARDTLLPILTSPIVMDQTLLRVFVIDAYLVFLYAPPATGLFLSGLMYSDPKTENYLKSIANKKTWVWQVQMMPKAVRYAPFVFLLFFLWATAESQLYQFVIRPSQGTNTEILSSFLSRVYVTIGVGNPTLAIQVALKYTLLFFGITSVVLLFSVSIYYGIASSRIRHFHSPAG